jgi:hypothetical protein
MVLSLSLGPFFIQIFSETANRRTFKPQKSEVKSLKIESVLLPSAVLRFDILRFAFSGK